MNLRMGLLRIMARLVTLGLPRRQKLHTLPRADGPAAEAVRAHLDPIMDEIWKQSEAGAERVDNPLQIDPRTTDIIGMHFQLEREMELALERLVARPDALSRLGFIHKISVLKALLDNPIMDRAAEQLYAFNELRNAAAHRRNPNLKPLIRKLDKMLEEDGIANLGELSGSEVLYHGATITGALQVAVMAGVLGREVQQKSAAAPPPQSPT